MSVSANWTRRLIEKESGIGGLRRSGLLERDALGDRRHRAHGLEDLSDFRAEDVADEHRRHVVLVLRVLLDEAAKAELFGVERVDELADDGHAFGKLVAPLAELRRRKIVPFE